MNVGRSICSLFFSCAGLSLLAAAPISPNENSQYVFHAPSSIPQQFVDAMNADKDGFYGDLKSVLLSDEDGLLDLVDKRTSLSSDYVPGDLVSLADKKSYVCSKTGMILRSPAEAGLEKMAAAALCDGITLVASSAYRSYSYQKTVYERNVQELGQAAADRESAKPGTSQHQLGTAVDFGSITDAFAQTNAGRWLAANASSYGWSLSFPEGYESVTGYRWESWHYRYVGEKAVAFQNRWFGGIQQYMLEFIHAWREHEQAQKTVQNKR